MNKYDIYLYTQLLKPTFKPPKILIAGDYCLKDYPRSNPRFYRGTRLTSHRLARLLPKAMITITKQVKERPDFVLAAWSEIIGPKLAPMTQAVSFYDGILTVRVHNATLYSILSNREKPKIIAAIRRAFPKIVFKTIYFRFG